jgi:hypothetical protein
MRHLRLRIPDPRGSPTMGTGSHKVYATPLRASPPQCSMQSAISFCNCPLPPGPASLATHTTIRLPGKELCNPKIIPTVWHVRCSLLPWGLRQGPPFVGFPDGGRTERLWLERFVAGQSARAKKPQTRTCRRESFFIGLTLLKNPHLPRYASSP